MKKTSLILTTGIICTTLLAACSNNNQMKDKAMNENKTSMTSKDKMSDSKKMSGKETEMAKDKMTTSKMTKGEKAPDFTLKATDGKTYRLSDLKGKKVYLKFWASWCSICLSTLPDTNKLAKKAGDDLVVLSVVSPNHNGEKSEEDFKKWFSGLDYKDLPVALDNEGKLLKDYGVRSYPTSVFIDRDGVLVDKHVGFMNAKDIDKKLASIK
ncbi:TlpA family protein disulfide reductase [Streptococcus didelphis]|uniref:TlpA family protein disulfide reductase n=1 Tax=Streptococcus didelphis TaxID=102886 RepID=A0ABY9LHV9_9STRE|nr:TlpA disulfide reductase family protein [Streptococcus didelphis]WMB28416.1 TlpA family protein disulfide reductase [Streptococcus didelphis]